MWFLNELATSQIWIEAENPQLYMNFVGVEWLWITDIAINARYAVGQAFLL